MIGSDLPAIRGGLGELMEDHDGFILDQWGVIHDGRRLYPDALAALRLLNERRKPVVILTNSSKTNAVNRDRLLHRFGVPSDLFTGLVSSAQVLRDRLVDRSRRPWSELGTRAFVVADGSDALLIQGTRLVPVPKVEDADMVMLLSVAPSEGLPSHQAWLDAAASLKLPLVCPSADLHSVTDSDVVSGMGPIIARYFELGGRVLNVGKPEEDVYLECAQYFHGINADRILAVGDQLHSDILGARRMGHRTALVATGATKAAFPDARTLPELAATIVLQSMDPSARPDFIMPALQP
ncbi:MAG: TIGR01459 family HAD-type hydrolase [Polyangiaceae bacterium]